MTGPLSGCISLDVEKIVIREVMIDMPGHAPIALAGTSPPPHARRTIASVSEERLARDMRALVGFGTRHTLSDTESDTRGIGAARRYVYEQYERANEYAPRGKAPVVASFDSHTQKADGRRITRDVEIVNVIATIQGTMPESKKRLYYVLSHLDSRASGATDAVSDSPGANDSASGVAMMMELARLFAANPPESTIVLMATTGEEQGLFGARLHALKALEAKTDIRAILNNDSVGDPYGPHEKDSTLGKFAREHIRVFAQGVPPEAAKLQLQSLSRLGAENDSPQRTLARHIGEIAEWESTDVSPVMIYRNDRFLRGGDHTPFNQLGYAGVRFTVPFEDYNRQHQDVRIEDGIQFGDLERYIDYGYLADITRLNATALVHLANAPSMPSEARLVVAELTNDTTIRWEPSPEPDVRGYEIVLRRTTSPFWERAINVGDVVEVTLDEHKDNWLFGVRAYDADGFRSPVAFPEAANE